MDACRQGALKQKKSNDPVYRRLKQTIKKIYKCDKKLKEKVVAQYV